MCLVGCLVVKWERYLADLSGEPPAAASVDLWVVMSVADLVGLRYREKYNS